MAEPTAMLTVQLSRHQIRPVALVLPLLDIQTPHSQHGVDFLPKLLADIRRHDALLLEHHPFRFRLKHHFLGEHILNLHLVPSKEFLTLYVNISPLRDCHA